MYVKIRAYSPDDPLRHTALKRLRAIASLLLIAGLATVLGCASGPGGNSSQRKAHKNLAKGVCPSFIVYPGERSQFARKRYNETASEAEVSGFRDRELANCEQALAAGDAQALHVVVEYWYVQQKSPQAAAAYKVYLLHGRDPAVLGEASAKLYEMYAKGAPGQRPDPAAAFHYLGLAAQYNPAAFELRYADQLHARGLYADAFSYYQAMLGENASGVKLAKMDACEINLKLADMYYRGRGVRENWYIGYYYWLQGSSMAGDAQWGSCVRDSFIYRDRYAMESERKRAVDRRMERLGMGETRKVKDAWKDQESKGLAYITALKFHRPPMPVSDNVPVVTASAKPSRRAATTTRSHVWRPWAPLGGNICQWHVSDRPISWSEVFQLRSGAIWTVKSMVGNTQSVGSAVAVSSSTLITNCHLLHAPSGVTLLKEGKSMRAQVLAADREGDRCILKASEPLTTYVVSARQRGQLLVGEDVAAIGNPKGLDTSLSRGLVAQKRDKNGHAYIQTDAAISSGSSGGGLFDTAGNLVGITTFKVASGESLNFAIAIDEFCR
jgi:hypothetical protein